MNERPGASVLAVRGLTYEYGSGEGVHDVDFSVAVGEVVALIGPNGSGKTTTVKCICGHLPDDGAVRVDGAPASSRRARRALALVPDLPDLFPVLTVAEHLVFRARSLELALDGDALDTVLAEVGMTEYRDRPAGQLSRGQRQRTVLAAAMLQRAKLLVLDEPTTGLDPPAQAWLSTFLRRTATGAGVLLTTHDLEFVHGTADRVLALRNGRIVGRLGHPASQPFERWRADVLDGLVAG